MSQPTRQIGPYQINHEIDQGGMATIYHATDTRDGDVVALKVLQPHLAKDSILLRRFQQEATEAQRLRHPNIVRVYEAGEQNGYHFIAMEYAAKGSLAKQLRTRNGLMSVDEIFKLLVPLAQALDYAHKRNVLHRDVKPNNVLIGADDRLLLTDFGISRRSDAEHLELTGFGERLGTPRYMSPEQIRGDQAIDHRSDIYSLGVLSYQLLTGHLPFEGGTHLFLMNKILHDPAPPPQQFNKQLPAEVCHVLLRVLDKEPDQRYDRASEFVEALQQGFTAKARKATGRGAVPSPAPLPPENPVTISLDETTRQGESWWVSALMIGIGVIVLLLIGWIIYLVISTTLVQSAIETPAAPFTPTSAVLGEQTASGNLTATRSAPAAEVNRLPACPPTSSIPAQSVSGEQIHFEAIQKSCVAPGKEIFFAGTVYLRGLPANDYAIHYCRRDAPHQSHPPVISGDSGSLDATHPAEWEPGYYKQIIQQVVEGEVDKQTWVVWLADQTETRLSDWIYWSSTGPSCATINFSGS